MTQPAYPSANSLCVVVLAGGAGRRIGGGKPQRTLAGESLLARAVALARQWTTDVAVAVKERPSGQPHPDVAIVTDDPAVDGPLSGLLAGLRWARSRGCGAVLTIPCDTPFLPRDLVGRLSAALAGVATPAVAVASSAGRLHPACALWTVDAETVLLREANAGRLSLTNLAGRLERRIVEWPVETIDPFFNINTPDELEAARSWLAKPER
ncbi:molybdenum cofactor guanylyltransferase [Pseudochelatococcus sp. B33]